MSEKWHQILEMCNVCVKEKNQYKGKAIVVLFWVDYVTNPGRSKWSSCMIRKVSLERHTTLSAGIGTMMAWHLESSGKSQ